MKESIKFPFDKNGNQMSYVDYWDKDVTYIENYEFESEMTIITYSRGRSAANFVLKDERGHTYNVFMKDMIDIIHNSLIDKGILTGRWTFCKRGQNYGIKLVKEE